LKTWKAELLLLLITSIWGTTFALTKLALDDCSVFFFMFIRFLIAFVLMYIFLGKHLHKIEKWNFKNGVILGILFAGGYLLQTVGLKYTSVTKSAFITGMSVVLTPFAFKFVIKKPIKAWQWVGVIISFIGLWIFTNPTIDNINIGDVFTLISTIFWALYLTYMDVYTKDITKYEHTIQLVFMQFLIAAPIGLIGHFAFDMANFKFHLTSNLIVALLYNGILASIILTIIHTSVQKYTTPVKAALIFTTEPVFATILAIIIISEIVTFREITGGIIIISAVIVSELGEYWFGNTKLLKI